MPDIHLSEQWPAMKGDIGRTCELLKAVGAGYLVTIPNVYSNLFTGERTAPSELDEESWKKLIEGTHLIADQARADWELDVVFHPHAETPVEYEHQIVRFLEDTDPIASPCAWTWATMPTAAATSSTSFGAITIASAIST